MMPALSMVHGQLMTNEILDPALLEALLSVPREIGLPEKLAGSAYVDEDLPIGERRYLLAPLTFARFLNLTEITDKDHVLDVGCGYGYTSLVLAKLAGKVTAIDTPELASQAKRSVADRGAKNVNVVAADTLADGYLPDAPYDVIIINGGTEIVPLALTKQMAEGGRLICVELNAKKGCIVLYRKLEGEVFRKETNDASAPLLKGFERAKHFLF